MLVQVEDWVRLIKRLNKMFETLVWIGIGTAVVAALAVGFGLGLKMTLDALSNMEPEKFIDVVQGLRAANDENPGMDKIKDILPKPNVRITVTAANNALLAHNAETGEFIAQGMDSQELIVSALQRYPNMMFIIAIEDNSVEVTP